MFIIAANDFLNCYSNFERLSTYVSNLDGFVTKSITKNPRFGNKLPHFYNGNNFILVSSGLCNPGLNKIILDIKEYINNFSDGPTIIPSIAADPDSDINPVQELNYMIEKLYTIGIKNIEINMACPNVKHDIDIFNYTKELMSSIVNLKVDINIIPKLTSSNSNELISLIRLISSYGFINISFAPYMPAIMLDENMKSVLGSVKGVICGGMNGFTTRSLLYDICQEVKDVNLIASGGCLSSSNNTITELLNGYKSTLYLGAHCVASVAPFWDFSDKKLLLLKEFVNKIETNKSLLIK